LKEAGGSRKGIIGHCSFVIWENRQNSWVAIAWLVTQWLVLENQVFELFEAKAIFPNDQ
jgi:hypothetical protein